MLQLLISCAKQTEKIPHIIVDGGSTDGTRELVGKCATVQFVEYPGSTLFQAFNKALECVGDGWVFFAGADDRFHDESTFDAVVKAVTSAEERGVYCLHGKIKHLGANEWTHSNRIESWVIHRSVFTKLGLFDTKNTYFADVAFQKLLLEQSIPTDQIDLKLAVVAPGGHSAGRRP
jgi:glycosyltransferase involved in cell wall biosynthesis